jgi:hypothetical protein
MVILDDFQIMTYFLYENMKNLKAVFIECI